MNKKDILNFSDVKKNGVEWSIGEAFLKGILLEVSSYPKPGLVSSISMGAHKDMNILTFMVSSASIAPAFFLCAHSGTNHKDDPSKLFLAIRKIGIIYERKLLESTKGVNTQRGILFAACILCGAAGYISQSSSSFNADNLFEIAAKMTKGIVSRELVNLNGKKDNLTPGEQLYIEYQATGIRGEVESGFMSVRNTGLPAFKDAISKGMKLNDCIVHTLISLIACVEDTTILWRKNKEELIKVQNQARKILENGSVFTEKGLIEIFELDEIFVKKNISPGGSADLVAVTIGVYLLENKQFPVAIL